MESTQTVNKQDFQKKIDAVGQNFLLKLKEDLPLLEDFAELPEDSKMKEETREGVINKLHKVAGSAKIFGFEKLGILAAEVRNNLKDKISDDRILKILQKDFAEFLQEAESAIQLKLEKISFAREKQKILFVDDDELIHELLSDYFHRMGYVVFNAKNGREGLEMIELNKPDVAIIDYMMPILDGISMIKKMKSNPKSSDIPIIMLTVKGQQENILQGLKSGATDYIIKPFDIEELSQRITGILQRAKKL